MYVEIDKTLTQDPLNKQGEMGILLSLKNSVARVIFEDAALGYYQFGTFKRIKFTKVLKP